MQDIVSNLSREFSFLQDRPQDDPSDSGQTCFEAQLLIRQALNENRDNFPAIINRLRARLESLVLKNDPGDENERSRLQEDINTSKKCLEVCKAASEVSSQKIHRIGEVIAADGDSDLVVVTTLADLLDIKKAVSKGNSAQLVGSMTEEALHHLTERRYSSRFGTFAQEYPSAETITAGTRSIHELRRPAFASHVSQGEQSPELKGTNARPSSNDSKNGRCAMDQIEAHINIQRFRKFKW
jgi:hypothetical protein